MAEGLAGTGAGHAIEEERGVEGRGAIGHRGRIWAGGHALAQVQALPITIVCLVLPIKLVESVLS